MDRIPTEIEMMVAKAIHDAGQTDWERTDGDTKAFRLIQARAAIRAMYEPTDEMMSAPSLRHHEHARFIWKEAIDLASPPQS